MATINFPDGSMIIDDSKLMPNWQARQMLAEGMTPEAIAADMNLPLPKVLEYLAEGPYESPQDYWMRRYNEGTHLDDDYDEDSSSD